MTEKADIQSFEQLADLATSDPEAFEATRRQFLTRSVAGAAAASMALGACTQAGEQEATDKIDDSVSLSDMTEADSGEKSESGVTVEDLAGAEKVMGIEYTDAERTQMLGTIDDQISAMQTLRSLDHPNTLQPAMTFDPRLPGKDYGSQVNSVIVAGNDPGPLPASESDIAFSSATNLGHWIRTGQISSRELTDLYLRRIEAHGSTLECFVTVTADIARAQADQADAEIAAGNYRGPLHGIPYGVKDLMDAEGTPATWGAMPYKDRQSAGDAIIVGRLREAGAVLIGKTTCGALAYGDIWFGGTTRNPWNINEGSSGSSAGSASSTSAGLVGFSIGTETLGSIVSPSERCGTTGLRPTFGRVARTGTMALCWSLDKIGPICRAVEDCALVLAAINGGDVSDASSDDHGFLYNGNTDVAGMRVGYSPAWFEASEDGPPGRAAQLESELAALEALRSLGVELVEVDVPDRPYGTMVPVLIAEAAAAFEEVTLKDMDDSMRWQVARAWPNAFREGRFFSAVDMVQADRLRRLAMEDMDELFSGIDALFGPNFSSGLLTVTNYTGQPQLTLRAGFMEAPSRGLFDQDESFDESPKRVTHNVSLWAPLYGEGVILNLGRRLEAALGVAGAKPEGFV